MIPAWIGSLRSSLKECCDVNRHKMLFRELASARMCKEVDDEGGDVCLNLFNDGILFFFGHCLKSSHVYLSDGGVSLKLVLFKAVLFSALGFFPSACEVLSALGVAVEEAWGSLDWPRGGEDGSEVGDRVVDIWGGVDDLHSEVELCAGAVGGLGHLEGSLDVPVAKEAL